MRPAAICPRPTACPNAEQRAKIAICQEARTVKVDIITLHIHFPSQSGICANLKSTKVDRSCYKSLNSSRPHPKRVCLIQNGGVLHQKETASFYDAVRRPVKVSAHDDYKKNLRSPAESFPRIRFGTTAGIAAGCSERRALVPRVFRPTANESPDPTPWVLMSAHAWRYASKKVL